jgi:hypothetical protein
MSSNVIGRFCGVVSKPIVEDLPVGASVWAGAGWARLTVGSTRRAATTSKNGDLRIENLIAWRKIRNFAKRKCTPASTLAPRPASQRNLLEFADNFPHPAHNETRDRKPEILDMSLLFRP